MFYAYKVTNMVFFALPQQDGSDIYYEPEDLTATYGPPDRPPPPIPKTSHPQTYNFSFLH